MKMPTSFKFAIGVAGMATVLAGCGTAGSASPSGLPSALTPSSRVQLFPEQFGLALRRPFHPHLVWAAPNIDETPRLLFLSDASTGDVTIYSMPDLIVRGQISGWTDLQGECAATSGDVYIIDAEARYAGSLSRKGEFHGIYKDGDGTPVSCAVSPLNGDLALTSNGASGGNILIYPGGVTGSGTSITVPHMHTYFFDGYDRGGHLWVDGYTADSKALIGSCTRVHCHTIPISGGTIFYPGFLQYASVQKTWYVADRECGGTKRFCIYPVSASGVLGKAITLTDAHRAPICYMFQGVITNGGRTVFGGVDNGVYSCGVNSVARWNIPAGGDPTNRIDLAGGFPTGAAISFKVGGF